MRKWLTLTVLAVDAFLVLIAVMASDYERATFWLLMAAIYGAVVLQKRRLS